MEEGAGHPQGLQEEEGVELHPSEDQEEAGPVLPSEEVREAEKADLLNCLYSETNY